MMLGQTETAPRAGQQESRTVLTFSLVGELFGLSVAGVQEIIDPLPLTPVPNADRHAPGLVNVRGSIVPVVDLRGPLGIPEAALSDDSRMVVLELAIAGETTKLAIVADSVEQVVEIEEAAIEPVPEIGIRWPTQHLDGIARAEDELVILLRPETLFQPASMAAALQS